MYDEKQEGGNEFTDLSIVAVTAIGFCVGALLDRVKSLAIQLLPTHPLLSCPGITA